MLIYLQRLSERSPWLDRRSDVGNLRRRRPSSDRYSSNIIGGLKHRRYEPRRLSLNTSDHSGLHGPPLNRGHQPWLLLATVHRGWRPRRYPTYRRHRMSLRLCINHRRRFRRPLRIRRTRVQPDYQIGT